MKKEIKYKGYTGDEWIIGDAVHLDEISIGIKRLDEKSPKYVLQDSICQFIGFKDKNGNDVYENDLIAVVLQYSQFVRDWCGKWDTEACRSILLFRIIRGQYGFFAEEVIVPEQGLSYGIEFATSKGVVVGNTYTCDDIGELYEKLLEDHKND